MMHATLDIVFFVLIMHVFWSVIWNGIQTLLKIGKLPQKK